MRDFKRSRNRQANLIFVQGFQFLSTFSPEVLYVEPLGLLRMACLSSVPLNWN